ncbi:MULTISPECIES: PucR family transcriptional regulator [Gordonia]|uniref:Putative CdaR family transcriptional regulator n=1 Tax=Gordonia sihwensis NBRC 108236 TaxID=1223544 RepID=L7LHW7_9ACTN|nr:MULTISPECIES: PucR family transcriptional regulator [Gordonia]AUH68117.1 PucR family transcriptional regulator [Gordonia sp. YC-JH1]MBY4569228.1 CdaR family transcriptional regulator [Gordonia sihwensis]GAC60336.1 putative CdaR family transcriptional regulator [Gordonia sihwensis NBRC 108236]
MNSPTTPRLNSPALLLLSDVDSVAEELAVRITQADRFYVDGGPLAEEELRGACRDNLAEIIRALAGAEPNLKPALAVGRLKAERGVPLAALLHAFRLGGRLIWEQLTALSKGPGDPEVHECATLLWELIDAFSDAAVEAYRDTETLLAHSDAQARYRLIRMLFDDHADGSVRSLGALRTLGVPEDGVFQVVVIIPADPGQALPAPVTSSLRDAGAQTVWDSQADVHIGLLRTASSREAVRAVDRLGQAVAGRIGVSAEFGTPLGIPEALGQARLAARSTPPGTEGLVRFGSDPMAHLLVTASGAARVFTESVLGGVLRLPPPDRDDLLSVLAEWYRCHGAAGEVAEALHCHRNTVRYRLRKVRDLTGRDVTDPVQSAELYAALRSVEVLGIVADE